MPENNERQAEDLRRDPRIVAIFSCPICKNIRTRTGSAHGGWVCTELSHTGTIPDQQMYMLIDKALCIYGNFGKDKRGNPKASKIAKMLVKVMKRDHSLVPPIVRGERRIDPHKKKQVLTRHLTPKIKHGLTGSGLFDEEEV